MDQPDDLSRRELIKRFQNEFGMTRREAHAIIAQIVDHLAAALEREGMVKIKHFGSFIVCERKGHQGRNPKTGESHPVSPRRVVKLIPSRNLAERVNSGRT